MVLSSSLIGLAALCLPSLVSCQTGEISSEALLDLFGTAEVTELEPTRYIVRFSDTGSARFRKRDGSLEAEAFFSVLAETDPEAKPAMTFDSELFHGASFDVTNSSAEAVTELLALPEVADVWPAARFTLPDAEATGVDKSSSAYTNWSPHRSTRVELAHAHGHTGKGVVIGVVDSGVDYTHPALGAGFGPGFKVESGWDFVGNDYIAGGPVAPDADPMDCNGHGTHVSGIIASDDDLFGGVAPGATLRAYKVFGCGGSTTEDVILAAFIKAHEDGVDIISASLGSNVGFPEAALSTLAAAIQAEGTFVSIAAGNAGSRGPYFTSSGGNGVGVTTVGSVQRDDFPGYTVLAQSSAGETREIAYLSDNELPFPVNGSIPGYAPEEGREAYICPFGGSAPPARRGAVLIHPRNDCSWWLHGRTLFGRIDFAFFYNSENTPWERPDREVLDVDQAKGFGLISYEDGDWLMSQIDAGHDITFDFNSEKAPVVVGDPNFEAGRMSWFSSWGPTLDARMKPEISAPGGDILSTWPVSGGSWAIQSGTSMATPYLTGIVALLFASRGGRAQMGPDAIPSTYRRLIASGKPVRHGFGTANLASIAHQGAGLVDAIKAIEYTTTVNPAILHLNDTANFVATQQFEVTNSGDEAVDYQLSHAPGSTTHTRPQANAWIGSDPPLVTGPGNVAEAVISDETFTLQPGESRTVTVTFTEPADVDVVMMPIYGGGIVVAGSHGEVVRVSYMGIKGSLYGQDIWEIERGVPLYFSVWLVPMLEGVQMPVKRGITPHLYYNQLFSTREMSFDWVSRNWTEADWQYPPVVGEKNFKGHFIGAPQGLSDTIPRFPMRNLVRNPLSTFFSDSIFAHGEEIPPGEYRLLGRVLRNYGDPHDIKDWQYGLSPWFNVTGELPDPPSTVSEAPPEPTVIPVRPCGHEGTPIKLTVRVGDDQEVFGTYGVSDFLAVDFSGLQTDPGHELTDDGHVIRPNGNNILNSVYMSVHSNANSLLYFRPRSQATGAWSLLDCEVRCEDRLRCASADVVPLYYTCDRGQGHIRRAVAVPEGCDRVRFTVEELQCPSPSVVSVPVPEVTTL